MRSLIGLKNMIMFSAVLLTIGSVSAQQAFAGDPPPDCKSSEYFDGGKCVALIDCTEDEFESKAPTANSDRVCSTLTECTDDEFESTSPTANSDRVCSTLPSIPIGGTVGSMSTTSLLVAGAQANMGWWIIALVGVVAGVGIAYKAKTNKTDKETL